MTVDVQTETVIERPLSQVFPYVCSPDNAPEWYANIQESHWVSEPGVRQGARAAFVAFFLGKKLEYTYEFTEYVENSRLIMTTAQGPFPMTTEYHFEPVGPDGSSTRVTLRNHGTPAGFSRLVAPLMKKAMRRANEKDLAELKRILESKP